MIFDILTSSCPLLVSSIGALFSEFAGVLALFLEGIICFGGFLTYAFTIFTKNIYFGILISSLICIFISGFFYFVIYKFKANIFIAGIAINLLFSFLTTFLSVKIFGTRGVLSSQEFNFALQKISSVSIFIFILSIIVIFLGIFFLVFTKPGLLLRVCGYDSEVLKAKGENPNFYKTLSWCFVGFYSCIAGSFLVMRISSYVPNISSGRGWMALASVYLGKKKAWKICLAVLIFCAADYFSSNIQNMFPQIPNSILLALPYFVMILLIVFDRK